MKESAEVRVVLDSSVPVYRQVVDQIRTLCVGGALVAGEKLPSVRKLAGNLGVHFNTIADAYRALAEEGWIAVEHGRGAVVLDRGKPAQPTSAVQGQHGSRLRHLIAELRGHGFDAKWIRGEVDVALSGTEERGR